MEEARVTVMRFRGIEIDPARNRVVRNGVALTIEPKPMEVLCVLARRNGEVVSRQELIDAVWGVTFGGDESLTRAISILRKVLKSAGDDPEVIRTISKRGYVFAAEPEDAVVPAAATQRPRRFWPWLGLAAAVLLAVIGLVVWHSLPPPVSAIEGIVVMVKPLDGDAAPAAVATNDLTAALARFDQIRVRKFDAARPDTRHDYVYVVAGTIKSGDGRTRIAVQVQDYASGDTLWSGSETYAGEAGHDGAISALSAQLEPAVLQITKTRVQKKPAITLSPWELVLLGTWVPGADREWQGPPTDNSYWVWDRAIAKDPDFALAHASLAQVMANFALFDPPSDTATHAERAAKSADRALQLAPYDAGVLYQIALYDRYAGRRDAAVATLKHVVALEPDNLTAQIELAFAQGQCMAASGDAIARLKALDDTMPPSDPRHWVILSRQADLALGSGDYRAAADYARRSRQIVRQMWSSITLAAADAELGQTAEAREVGMEHQGQWPHLDYNRFADGNLTRWCYGGDTRHAADAFHKLGRIIASKSPA